MLAARSTWGGLCACTRISDVSEMWQMCMLRCAAMHSTWPPPPINAARRMRNFRVRAHRQAVVLAAQAAQRICAAARVMRQRAGRKRQAGRAGGSCRRRRLVPEQCRRVRLRDWASTVSAMARRRSSWLTAAAHERQHTGWPAGRDTCSYVRRQIDTCARTEACCGGAAAAAAAVSASCRSVGGREALAAHTWSGTCTARNWK